MGKRGPAPEPTHLKIIKGNPGHRPLNEKEPKPCPIFKLPPAPKWMDKYAKAEWRRMGKILMRIGVLTEADLGSFTNYCCTYARWRHAEENVIAHFKEEGTYLVGSGFRKQRHPELITIEKALGQMLQFAQQFGMTPSARTSIKVDRPIDDKDFFGD